MQIETAPQIPNTGFITSSKTTLTHMKTELHHKNKLNQKLHHTKITLQRNAPTKNNKPNTQVYRLPKGSTDPIQFHNKFGSLDTMYVDLDPNFNK